MNLSLISSYFFPLFQISFFSWRSVWFVLSDFWILLSGWDSFPCELDLKAKPAWFVLSWAADGAGGAELREREESSGEGIWRQKGGTEGKLNCRAGGEEEDDWKWEINNGADGRWEPELERTSGLCRLCEIILILAVFFSLSNSDSMEVKPIMTRKLRRRPNDPVPIPDKRRKPAPDTLYKRPLFPTNDCWLRWSNEFRACGSWDRMLFCGWWCVPCVTSLTQQASSLILHTSAKLFANRWPDHGGSEDAKQGKRPFVAWKVCRVLRWLIFFHSIYSAAQVTQTARWVRTGLSWLF